MTITRRSFLAAPALTWEAASRPNLVMILADDLGWGDLGLNGAPDIGTPRIDAIARAGVRFTQSYSSAPECSPTRCALLTGRYPQRVGGLECAIGVGDTGRYDEAAWLQSRGELGLPPEQATLAPLLARSGYDTALFGKWHLGYREKFLPTRQGFREYFGILGGAADYYTHEEPNEGRGQKPLLQGESRVERKGNLTDLFAEAATEWLRRPRQNPFFLYLPFTAPHDPLQNPAEYDAAAGTAPQRPKDRKSYAAMVAHLDRRVGDVLDQLERMGAAGNTLIVFHSDNGGTAAAGRNTPWRGAKSSVFEGGIRSPLFMSWPGRIKAGSVCGQPAMTMDITATLLGAAGADTSGARLDGMDLLPYATGVKPIQTRSMYWRYKRGDNRRKAIRDGRWKYISDSGAEYLFDLEADPAERGNLIGDNPALLAQLKAKLTSWEAETAAPRLRAFQPKP